MHLCVQHWIRRGEDMVLIRTSNLEAQRVAVLKSSMVLSVGVFLVHPGDENIVCLGDIFVRHID